MLKILFSRYAVYCKLSDRAIRHRACALKDTAFALISSELDPEFEKLCEDITKARVRRGMWFVKICLYLHYHILSYIVFIHSFIDFI